MPGLQGLPHAASCSLPHLVDLPLLHQVPELRVRHLLKLVWPPRCANLRQPHQRLAAGDDVLLWMQMLHDLDRASMHAAYTPPASAGPPLRGCCWGPPPAARRGRSYSPSWARLWNEHQSEGQHYCDDPLPKSRNRAEVQWRQAATQGLQCLLLNAPESGQVSPSFFMVAGLAPAARALLRISSRSCRFLLLTSFASASSADICGVRCTALSHCKVYRSVTAAFPPQYYEHGDRTDGGNLQHQPLTVLSAVVASPSWIPVSVAR